MVLMKFQDDTTLSMPTLAAMGLCEILLVDISSDKQVRGL